MSPPLAELPERRHRFLFDYRSLLSFLLLSLLLALAVSFYQEVSYWYLASAQNHLGKGEFAAALKRVEQAQRWTPQADKPFLVRAQVLLANQQLDAALEATQAGLALQPDSRELRLYRVWIMLELKREREMYSLLVPPEKLSENDVVERVFLAEALLHRLQPELAVETLLPLKGHALENESVQKMLCRALRQSKRYEEALVESKAAFETKAQVALHSWGASEFFDEYLQNLLLLKRYDDLLEAIHQREIAIIKVVRELRIEELNGFAYYRAIANRELETAEIMALQAVANTNARDDSVLDTLAYVLYRRGKLKKSLELMEQTIVMLESQTYDWENLKTPSHSYPSPLQIAVVQQAIDRKAAVYYYHRALMYFDLDRAADGRKDLERVTKLRQTPGDELF